MKRPALITALLCSALLLPDVPLWAGHDMATMEMAKDAQTISLPATHQDGVMAKGELHDVRQAMAKHGMKETHHLMVMFSEMKDGKPLTAGTVALKVSPPSGTKGEPRKMMLMGDGFGADVALSAPGTYGFEVGSKLNDGKRRVFTFTYDNK
jgi:hypothetical protein